MIPNIYSMHTHNYDEILDELLAASWVWDLHLFNYVSNRNLFSWHINGDYCQVFNHINHNFIFHSNVFFFIISIWNENLFIYHLILHKNCIIQKRLKFKSKMFVRVGLNGFICYRNTRLKPILFIHQILWQHLLHHIPFYYVCK